MGEILIEEMNYKVYMIVFINVVLLLVACAITILGVRVQRLSYWVPGIFMTGAFMMGFFVSMVKAMQVKKLIAITIDGIIDYSSIGGESFFSYDDIKEFSIISVYERKAIAIIPKNIDSFLPKYNAMKRKLMKRNISMNLPPVTILVDVAKDMDPEDILTLIQKRLADYSSL